MRRCAWKEGMQYPFVVDFTLSPVGGAPAMS
jgi:hypothetical protein